jgi:WD40 repeat protein
MPVSHVVMFPNGRHVLSSSIDSSCVWELETGRELRRGAPLIGSQMVMCPDGRHVLMSVGSAARLFDVETFKGIRAFPHPAQVVGVAVSPDGRYALTGQGRIIQKDGKNAWTDCTVTLWEVSSGKELRRFEGHTGRPDSVAFSPDGRYGLSGGDKTIRMWDLGLGSSAIIKPPPVPPVQPVPPVPPVPPPAVANRAAVPDSDAQDKARKLVRDLFKRDYARITKSADRAALAAKLIQKAMDTKDDPTARFVLLREACDLAAQAGDIPAVIKAIDQLTESFAVDAVDMKLKALTAASKAAMSVPASKALAESCLSAIDDALTMDNFAAAVALVSLAEPAAKRSRGAGLTTSVQTRGAEVREAEKEYGSVKAAAQTLVQTPADPPANLITGRYSCLYKGEWDKGLPRLAAGNDPTLQALAKKELAKPAEGPAQIELGDAWWDLGETKSGAVKAQLQHHAAYWYEQALAGATGLTRDRLLQRLKQVDDNSPANKPAVLAKELRRFTGHTGSVNSVVFSTDGKQALSGGNDRALRFWEVQSGQQLFSLKLPGEIHAVAWSPDGKFAFGAYQKGGMGVATVDKRGSGPGFGFGQVNAMACLPDNERIVTGGSRQAPYLVKYTAPTQITPSRMSNPAVIHSLAVSADGRQCLFGCADGSAQIWEVETARTICRMLGHKDEVLGVALTRDARRAVTAGADRTIRVWDAQTGAALRVLSGHQGRVACIALCPDDRHAVTASDDKTVRLWDIKTGRELRRFHGHTDAVTSVAISPDGHYALSASADGSIRLWDLSR